MKVYVRTAGALRLIAGQMLIIPIAHKRMQDAIFVICVGFEENILT